MGSIDMDEFFVYNCTFNDPTYIVDDSGIFVKLPNHEFAYETLIPKEVFIEAYNRYICDDASSNSNKEVIG